jgi:hypothetical protein
MIDNESVLGPVDIHYDSGQGRSLSRVDRQPTRSVVADNVAKNAAELYQMENRVEAYFSADIETDGPIPGPYSILSFALVYAGRFDGALFERPGGYDKVIYKELKPISTKFQLEALKINGLDRQRLCNEGEDPQEAMVNAYKWVEENSSGAQPVLVAYPLSFDWSWLYWYFINFCPDGSPFGYSRCFDIKTAFSVKAGIPVALSGRSRLPKELRPSRLHTHHAIDDAVEQAEIFANVFEWGGANGCYR